MTLTTFCRVNLGGLPEPVCTTDTMLLRRRRRGLDGLILSRALLYRVNTPSCHLYDRERESGREVRRKREKRRRGEGRVDGRRQTNRQI